MASHCSTRSVSFQPQTAPSPRRQSLIVGIGTGFNVSPVLHTGDGVECFEAEFGHVEPSDDKGYSDPEVERLRRELNSLKGQNRQIETQYQTERQRQAYEQVQQFRDEQDADGNPAHPFFDDVQDKMRGLLMSGAAQDLQEAYEQAVWTNPKYRESFAEQQRKEAQREEAKRREEAAKRAKKTATSVKGKSSVPPPPKQNRTMLDDMLEAWDQSVKGEL